MDKEQFYHDIAESLGTNLDAIFKKNSLLNDLTFTEIKEGSYTYSNTKREPMRFQDLEEALERLRGTPPANWILMSPNGNVYKGSDPMILAAQVSRAYQL